ncbi:TonB-dependent receptor [bacterium]|nr:TonB-dependent receptor [bacterium]NUN45782.1 TonB-dependent receptor [bacterium]
MQSAVYSQSAASLSGIVRDSDTREPMIGAYLKLAGTSLGAVSDREGRFRISGIASGSYTLKVSYLGYTTYEKEITVAAGDHTKMEILLKAGSIELSGSEVYGMREGQAKALNLQKNADNQQVVTSSEIIKLFPDPNISEALQRMPGVAVLRDQGEGRYVFLRGLEPKYSSVKINGQPVPSPEGDIRQVSLDVISSSMVSRIEVSKTLTPDMDADAVAGAINLVTKNALDFDQQMWQVSAGTGRNMLEGKPLANFDITYGNRFGEEKRLGVFVNAMGYYTHRNSDDMERVWGERAFNGKNHYFMNEFELRDYNAIRKRLSFNAATDYRFSETSDIHFGAVHNYFRDDEIRRRLRIKLSEGSAAVRARRFKFVSDSSVTMDSAVVERETKDWALTRSLTSFQMSGHAQWADMDWTYSAALSRATEAIPDRFDFTTRQTDVNLKYDMTNRQFPKFAFLSGDPYDPALFKLKNFEVQEYDITEWDRIAELNIRKSLRILSNGDYVQSGAKVRSKAKERNDEHNRATIANPNAPPFMNFFAESDEDINFLYSRYRFGTSADPSLIRRWADTVNLQNSAAYSADNNFITNYKAAEKIVAVYGLSKIYSGSWEFLAGVRMEKTYIDYDGIKVVQNGNRIRSTQQGYPDTLHPAGYPIDTISLNGKHEYYQLFPSVNIKYSMSDRFVMRGAISRAIFRADYFDLIPYEVFDYQNLTIARGNTYLRPTTSWNFDLSADYYFQNAGIIAGGVYYKYIDDFIYQRQYIDSTNIQDGVPWIVNQKQNGKAAKLFGAEFNWQQTFTFLPPNFDGLGIYLNYAYTHSQAYYPQRPGNKNTLPGQPNHVGNFALTYEKKGFAARVAWNYSGPYVLTVSDSVDTDFDTYVDRHLQLDISASQKLTKHIRIYLELNNLTNEPYREYVGSRKRLRQQEYYSWWGKLGAEYTF